MADKVFVFHGTENSNDTLVINQKCVWDVVIFSQQPKLKRSSQVPANPEFVNCPNICAKLPDETFLARKGRLCFYPHSIIICKTGIEPAPKAGIPPFRTNDFVEISRHFIAQFVCVERYFLLRIGSSSDMGCCEVWVQCESDDHATEINRKLQEIIQRENLKKQQTLQTIRGQQLSSLPNTSSASNPSTSNQYCKQQQAEREVAQKLLLLPHYYQNLNESYSQSLVRPNCSLGPSQNKRPCFAQLTNELCVRSKSLGLEEQQASNFRSFAGRFWTMDKADSILLLGAGYGHSMHPEETEDSGGTLKKVPCGNENKTAGGSDGSSAAPSCSSTSFGHPTSSQTKNYTPEDVLATINGSTNSAGLLIEAHIERPATVCDDIVGGKKKKKKIRNNVISLNYVI
uniref:Uncharacterized protein n=1 Tax=Meloidogyne enterolobii TaxID=390850 RepID=A0A6V7XP59_MELEN|nr:unnamed protein product [Meloidogyne enterolobii]